jgi:uncharacterized Tic20 family protein
MIKIKYYFLTLFLLAPVVASAQLSQTTGLDDAANGTGLIRQTDTRRIVAGVINGLLGFLGMLFMILVIYGGLKWMTARGNSTQVDDAKKVIMNASIGLAVVVLSYVIVRIVLDVLGAASTTT